MKETFSNVLFYVVHAADGTRNVPQTITFALSACNFRFCFFHNSASLHKKSKNDTTVQPDSHWEWEGNNSIGKTICSTIIPPKTFWRQLSLPKTFHTRVIFWALLLFLQPPYDLPESGLSSFSRVSCLLPFVNLSKLQSHFAEVLSTMILSIFSQTTKSS